MTFRRYIAVFSLLTSVLLGGLIAPLSHFAYMALSDTYAMPMGHSGAIGHPGVADSHSDGMASMTHQVDGPTTPGETGLLPTASTHPECPFAAFFLSQSSAVSTDAACLSDVVFSSPLNEHVTASLTSRAVPALIARGPPAGILISA